jgi:hypothetical protein
MYCRFDASQGPAKPANAITCCFLSSLKTLLTLSQGIPATESMSEAASLAGFQVITYGRVWVFTKAGSDDQSRSASRDNRLIMIKACPICESTEFQHNQVLWQELIAEWELQAHEHAYIDEQLRLATTLGPSVAV